MEACTTPMKAITSTVAAGAMCPTRYSALAAVHELCETNEYDRYRDPALRRREKGRRCACTGNSPTVPSAVIFMRACLPCDELNVLKPTYESAPPLPVMLKAIPCLVVQLHNALDTRTDTTVVAHMVAHKQGGSQRVGVPIYRKLEDLRFRQIWQPARLNGGRSCADRRNPYTSYNPRSNGYLGHGYDGQPIDFSEMAEQENRNTTNN